MNQHITFIILVLNLASVVINARQLIPGSTELAQKEADEMFIALGGREKWAKMKSLHIRALHIEPGLEKPYQNENWRDMEEFKLRIEQKNQHFNNLGLFSQDAGQIYYLDRDSSRQLSNESLERFIHSHDFNVYVLLNRIAKGNDFTPSLNGQRLEFFRNGEFVTAFILNENKQPAIFITRKPDGSGENVSYFRKWETNDGFTHPVAGGTVDGAFYFETELWEPGYQSFGKIYDLKSTPNEN